MKCSTANHVSPRIEESADDLWFEESKDGRCGGLHSKRLVVFFGWTVAGMGIGSGMPGAVVEVPSSSLELESSREAPMLRLCLD